MADERAERTSPRRHHRGGNGDAARQRSRVDLGEPRRGRVGCGADHALRHVDYDVALRVRAEGLRADEVDRPQAGAAHGHVLAVRSLGARAWQRRTAASSSLPSPERVGAAVATGIGGLTPSRTACRRLLERGPDRTSPFPIVQIIPNMAAAWVSMELGRKGHSRPSAPPARRRTWRSATGSTPFVSAAPT